MGESEAHEWQDSSWFYSIEERVAPLYIAAASVGEMLGIFGTVHQILFDAIKHVLILVVAILSFYCKHYYNEALCDDVYKQCFSFHVLFSEFVYHHFTTDHAVLYKTCMC